MNQQSIARSASLLFAAALAACSQDTVRADAESWLGMDEAELRAFFGTPSSTIDRGKGRRTINYRMYGSAGQFVCVLGFDVGRTGYVIEVNYKSCPPTGVYRSKDLKN